MTFGEKLKELREDYGLTQEQLAQKVQLSKPNICKYEKGSVEPNIETLVQFSEIFNITLDYLLGKTEIKKSVNSSFSELDTSEEEILGIFRKLNEEKQNKVIGYAEAQLNDDDNITYIGYNAAMGGERTETRHTKEETKKLIDAFEAEFGKDVPPID